MRILKKISFFFSIRKIIITCIGAAISTIIVFGLQSYLNPEPKRIDSHFYKCETSDAVIYMGELINTQAGHAKDLILCGVFSDGIIDFSVNAKSETKIEYNKPKGTVFANIKRLSSGGDKCTFNIITAKNTDVKESFTISWGDKGKELLKVQTCDEKIQRGIDIGSKLSKQSHKARQTVVERNDN